MAVVRESSWYQEMLQEGEARGEARGSKQEAIAILLKQLTRHLGIDAASWRQRLESLTIEQLETLAEDLFDFSSEADLVVWMSHYEQWFNDRHRADAQP
jgi:predicted transposase YdaD